jgi:hypothetical protein
MRKTLLMVILSVLVYSFFTLILITQQGNEPMLTVVSDGSSIVLALLATFGCWFVYKKIPVEFFIEKRGWFLAFVGFVFFAFGDIYWGYSEIVRGVEVPIGSIADVAWTLAYFVLLASLAYMLRIVFYEHKWRVYTISALTGLAAIIYAVFHIIHLTIPQGHGLVDLIQDAYVFYDILILGMILIFMEPVWNGHNRFMNACVFFGMAFLSRIIFDFMFATMTSTNTYSTGSFIDLLYQGSYLLIVLATDAKIKMLERHKNVNP